MFKSIHLTAASENHDFFYLVKTGKCSEKCSIVSIALYMGKAQILHFTQ